MEYDIFKENIFPNGNDCVLGFAEGVSYSWGVALEVRGSKPHGPTLLLNKEWDVRYRRSGATTKSLSAEILIYY